MIEGLHERFEVTERERSGGDRYAAVECKRCGHKFALDLPASAVTVAFVNRHQTMHDTEDALSKVPPP